MEPHDGDDSDEETGGESSSSSSSTTAQPPNSPEQPEYTIVTADLLPQSSGGASSSSSSASSSAQQPTFPQEPEYFIQTTDLLPQASGGGGESSSSSSQTLLQQALMQYSPPTRLVCGDRITTVDYRYIFQSVNETSPPEPKRSWIAGKYYKVQVKVEIPDREPDARGMCRFVNERGLWQKVEFRLYDRILQLRYLDGDDIPSPVIVFGKDVINRGLVGPVAIELVGDPRKWPPAIPDDCEPNTLLLYFGDAPAPNLWLVFPAEPAFLTFYGYWKDRVCEIKEPRGRGLRASFELYEAMRARNNI